jgi:hypothetical protein
MPGADQETAMTALVHAAPRLRRRALVAVLMRALAGIVSLSGRSGFLQDTEAYSLTEWRGLCRKLVTVQPSAVSF